jgi:hypothetical protein
MGIDTDIPLKFQLMEPLHKELPGSLLEPLHHYGLDVFLKLKSTNRVHLNIPQHLCKMWGYSLSDFYSFLA